MVNEWLDRALPGEHTPPRRVHAAMRFAVLGGGKRLRPHLSLEVARCLDVDIHVALPVAGCIELLHASSLVFDDLPSMDDDSMRRGRPSTHAAYGEATAILAGTALLVATFEHVAASSPSHGAALVLEFARAAGTRGLVGGQARDLFPIDEPEPSWVVRTHAEKTGSLFGLACAAPAILAGRDAADVDALRAAGVNLGIAFQIADDVADRTSTFERLGKAPGSDARQGRASLPSVESLEGAEARAREHLGAALDEIERVSGARPSLQWVASLFRGAEPDLNGAAG